MLIRRGAEAEIYKESHESETVVVKKRIQKGYRHPVLDEEIRHSRTKRESRLLHEARRAGIPVPRVVHLSEFEIKIEFLEGPRIKDILNSQNYKDLCSRIGKYLGLMHSYNIVHGDVTTSNMIFHNGDLFFIDFGLGEVSQSVELHATDLYVLEEALKAAHFEIWEKCMKIVFDSYKKSNPRSDAILEQLKKIKLRARYMERIG